jgi:hypothetical protein
MMLGRRVPVLAFLAATGATLVGCGLSTSGLQSGGVSSDAGVDVASGRDSGSGGSDATNLPDDSGAVDGTLPGDDGPSGDDAIARDDAPSTMSGCTGATPVQCGSSCAADCTQCTGAPLACRATGTCVADCTSCTQLPTPCFACDNSYMNPHGSCEAADPMGYCLGGLGKFGTGPYASDGFTHHCNCNQGQCFTDGETCVQGKCFACGEPGTDKQACQGGGTCQQATEQCIP